MSLKLAFYGDDFTGSTDALEVLAFAGMRCALFLTPPSPEALERLGPLDAFGVAGDSRAMTPVEMDQALPTTFDALARSGAPIVHYKVCSTFDSSPAVGNIGHAIEIGRRATGQRWVPVVAGTPQLQRYCAFGNLFARSATDNQVHRIDRHPIMRAHPVTPMDEGDLRIHLARQAALKVGNLPFPALDAGFEKASDALEAELARGAEAVVMDATSAAHLTLLGQLLEQEAVKHKPLFAVGSSGLQYALTQWWRSGAVLAPQLPDYTRFAPVQHVLAVSASASALSALQIDAAVQAGFAEVAVDAAALLDPERGEATALDIIDAAKRQMQRGLSVILHAARGPDDPRIEAAVDAIQRHDGLGRDESRHAAGRTLGRKLGRITLELLRSVPTKRLLLSGGDTSSQILKALAPEALVVAARLAPGAPLCRLIARDDRLHGLEVALKGGQMGGADFFEAARLGRT